MARPGGGMAAVTVTAASLLAVAHLVSAGRSCQRELAGARTERELLEARLDSLRDALVDTGREADRLRSLHRYSTEFRIPADLAASIHDAAVAAGVEAGLAFRLVQVESSFRRWAVSDAGAVGYTQIMPATAAMLSPAVSRERLFDPETNLSLGFRYLRLLLDRYGGDMGLSLLAYNRGPGRVDDLLARGVDPANGYAARVLAVGEAAGHVETRLHDRGAPMQYRITLPIRVRVHLEGDAPGRGGR